jgi:catechol 2,3-dioxygenase-like lactoylglutathione lyase family enzyme
MEIQSLDHLVLTVRDLDATIDFYTRVLGMRVTTFADDRKALHFGTQKINLHRAGHEIQPHALHPVVGSADLCFITATSLGEVIAHLQACGVAIEPGLPDGVARLGAQGTLRSVYVRDPDGNLIEIANTV